MTKKIVALVLMLAIAISLCGIVSAEETYSEPKTMARQLLEKTGIMMGYPDGSFGEGDTLTRAQAAKIVAYADLGEEKAETLTVLKDPFDDVTLTHWAAKYISYCVEKGIVQGVGNNKFDPEGIVNYMQLMAMTLRMLGYGDYTSFVGEGWDKEVSKVASSIPTLANATLTNEEAVRGEVANTIYAAIFTPIANTNDETGKAAYSTLAEKQNIQVVKFGNGTGAIAVNGVMLDVAFEMKDGESFPAADAKPVPIEKQAPMLIFVTGYNSKTNRIETLDPATGMSLKLKCTSDFAKTAADYIYKFGELTFASVSGLPEAAAFTSKADVKESSQKPTADYAYVNTDTYGDEAWRVLSQKGVNLAVPAGNYKWLYCSYKDTSYAFLLAEKAAAGVVGKAQPVEGSDKKIKVNNLIDGVTQELTLASDIVSYLGENYFSLRAYGRTGSEFELLNELKAGESVNSVVRDTGEIVVYAADGQSASVFTKSTLPKIIVGTNCEKAFYPMEKDGTNTVYVFGYKEMHGTTYVLQKAAQAGSATLLATDGSTVSVSPTNAYADYKDSIDSFVLWNADTKTLTAAAAFKGTGDILSGTAALGSTSIGSKTVFLVKTEWQNKTEYKRYVGKSALGEVYEAEYATYKSADGTQYVYIENGQNRNDFYYSARVFLLDPQNCDEVVSASDKYRYYATDGVINGDVCKVKISSELKNELKDAKPGLYLAAVFNGMLLTDLNADNYFLNPIGKDFLGEASASAMKGIKLEGTYIRIGTNTGFQKKTGASGSPSYTPENMNAKAFCITVSRGNTSAKVCKISEIVSDDNAYVWATLTSSGKLGNLYIVYSDDADWNKEMDIVEIIQTTKAPLS